MTSAQIHRELSSASLEARTGTYIPARSARFRSLCLLAILLTYVVLATGVSLTKMPICDEGWYADPAVNLFENGTMGSPVIQGAGSFLKGIDRYTYWEMPLRIVIQAGWYKLFGVSLFSTRAVSIVAGLFVLICWYVAILQTTGDWHLASLAAVFAGTDSMFLALAATGRSDMLSVAFGSMAVASYLLLRTKRFKLALLLAHTFVVASGLTHPNGGLIAIASLLLLHIYLDRNIFGFGTCLIIMIPYLVGSLGWGLYIMKAPDAFWAQFTGNSAQRLWPLMSPVLAAKREIVERLLGGYQAGASWTSFAKLRLLVLLGYLSGLLGMALSRDLRRSRLAYIVSGYSAITFLILLFFEGSKQPWFLIYLIWPFAAAIAGSLQWYWKHCSSWRPILVLGMLGFGVIQIGYPVFVMATNNYQNSYCPTVTRIAGQAKEPRSVMGSAELGFGLGFQKVSDDHFLSYYTHREPSFIVFDPNNRAYLEGFRRDRPEVYRYVKSLLARRYHQVYSNSYYTVWAIAEVSPQD